MDSFPSDMMDPLWLFIYGCTSKDASTHHFKTCVLSASIFRSRFLFSKRYFIALTNFLYLSLSGVFTLVFRNSTASCRSICALLYSNSSFSIMLFNYCLSPPIGSLVFLFATKRFSAYVIAYSTYILSLEFFRMSSTQSYILILTLSSLDKSIGIPIYSWNIPMVTVRRD